MVYVMFKFNYGSSKCLAKERHGQISSYCSNRMMDHQEKNEILDFLMTRRYKRNCNDRESVRAIHEQLLGNFSDQGEESGRQFWIPQNKGIIADNNCFTFIITSSSLEQNHNGWPLRQIWMTIAPYKIARFCTKPNKIQLLNLYNLNRILGLHNQLNSSLATSPNIKTISEGPQICTNAIQGHIYLSQIARN